MKRPLGNISTTEFVCGNEQGQDGREMKGSVKNFEIAIKKGGLFRPPDSVELER